MSRMSLSSKQKAIYAGLKPLLNEDQLLDAMLIWQDKYAKQEGFFARYFSNEVAELTKNTIAPKKILVSIVAELTSQKNHTEDPSSKINQYRLSKKRGSTQHFKLQEIEAFTVLTNKMLSLCSEPLRKALCLLMKKRILELPIDANLSLQISQWFGDRQSTINANNIALSDLRKIVSLFYSECCQLIGPVKSDTLLATALQKLESNGGAIYSDLFKKML